MKKLDKGMRYTANGTIEMSGKVYRKDGIDLKYSVTRADIEELRNIKAKLRTLEKETGIENDIERIKIEKHTDRIIQIKKGQQTENKNSNLSKNIFVNEYVDYFLYTHRKNGERGRKIEDTTFASYLDKGNFIKQYLGNKKVKELTFEDIEDFINKLHKRTCDTTARQTRDLVVSMMKYAKKDGIITDNILQDETITLKEHKGKKLKKIIQQEDIETFVKYCKDKKYYDLIFLLCTGVRR